MRPRPLSQQEEVLRRGMGPRDQGRVDGGPLEEVEPEKQGASLAGALRRGRFPAFQGRAGGVPAAFHLVMEDAAPKSGLEPRREVLVVASAAARFAGLQAEEGLPYQGPVHCPREARIGDREGAASRQEDRLSFQENAQGSRRQERGGGQVSGRQRAPSAQSFCALRASHLCPARLPRGLRSQAALERKRRRARDPERGARGAPGGRCPKNAQRCDESSFENSSGHRVAETTSAPPSPVDSYRVAPFGRGPAAG